MSKRVVFTPPLSAFFFSFLSLASFFLIALVLLVSSSHRPTEVRTEHLDFGCRAVLVFVLVFVDCECSLGVFEWVFNICSSSVFVHNNSRAINFSSSTLQ